MPIQAIMQNCLSNSSVFPVYKGEWFHPYLIIIRRNCMINHNSQGGQEQNAVIFFYRQYLLAPIQCLGLYPVFGIYMDTAARMADRNGVQVINFTICPACPMFLLKAGDIRNIHAFIHGLNTAMANVLRTYEGGKHTRDGKVFMRKPLLVPIAGFASLLECSLFIHHCNDHLAGTKMARGGMFNNWNSSLRRYEEGLANKENDYLLSVLDLDCQQYMRIFSMKLEERRRLLEKLASVQDKAAEGRMFKRNPELPYSTDVSGIHFINEPELAECGIRMDSSILRK